MMTSEPPTFGATGARSRVGRRDPARWTRFSSARERPSLSVLRKALERVSSLALKRALKTGFSSALKKVS